jgi:hypothetical protein
MTRTVPSGIATAIASSSFRLPKLVHVEFASGSVLTFTDWDVALAVDLNGDGSQTYAINKIEGLSDFSAQINAPIDDSELSLIIDGTSITADHVRRGRYDNAVVTVGYVLPTDLANPWLHRKYDTGQARIEGLRIKWELMGPEKRLEQPVSRVLTANCPWNFGDSDCGIQTTAPVWQASHSYPLHRIVKRLTGSGIYWFKVTDVGTSGGSEPTWPTTNGGTVIDGGVEWTAFRARRLIGTVSGVTSRRVFDATGISVTNDFFAQGFLTWLTGSNAGDPPIKIRSDNGSGHIVLDSSSFDTIQVGDTFEALVGCRKRLTADCITKHDNEANSRTRTLRFGGFPYLAEENVTATANKG